MNGLSVEAPTLREHEGAVLVHPIALTFALSESPADSVFCFRASVYFGFLRLLQSCLCRFYGPT